MTAHRILYGSWFRWTCVGALLVAAYWNVRQVCFIQPQHMAAHQRLLDQVHNANFVLEMMTRELRLAGYNPTGAAFARLTYRPTHLHMQADLNGNGTTDEPNEDVRYTYAAGPQHIIRVDCTGEEIVAEHIRDFTVLGLDAEGRPTLEPDEVRQLRLTITADIAPEAAPTAEAREATPYTLSIVVHLRNTPSVTKNSHSTGRQVAL